MSSPTGNTDSVAALKYAQARRQWGALIKFFTITEVAECLNISTRTVRRWIKSGALPVHSIGGVVRVSDADFAAFLAVRRNGA